MTLSDLAEQLPNGFHDTNFKSILIDFEQHRVSVDVSVWVATESTELELYRDGTLTITGLQFLTMEPPDPRYEFAQCRDLTVDVHEVPPANRVPAMAAIPADCFTSRFFVMEWNSFIYVAGRDASLEWRGDPYDRAKK